MSKIDGKDGSPTGTKRSSEGAHAEDPRVVRSRAAVIEAARSLFLRQGYAGTTMEEIAALAGRTKRTLYNNFADKEALFTRIVEDVVAHAERFARGLSDEFTGGITHANLSTALQDLARRLVLAVVQSDVVALRRLLIGEARAFPELAREYFDRAPGQVIDALASGFEHLQADGLLRVPEPRRAAAQFAYLVVGEPLDRAILAGTIPSEEELIACAQEGVETFLGRYAVG